MEATALSIGKSVLSGAVGYAKSALAEEVALQLGVTRDQAFVRDEMEMMLSFLMAAHEERDKHIVVETWVRQVRVVAYDVEDSLMDFAVRVNKQSWWLPWRIPRNLRDRRHVAKQMKDLRAKVEDVSQRKKRYLIEAGSSSKPTASAGDTAASAAAMFGINEARYAAKTKDQPRLDLTQLINQEGEDLTVIAVWGTSGNVGHKSIIWEAYENSDTQKNFHCRAWVRVMHPFNPKEFIQSLLEEAVHVGFDFLIEAEKKTGQELVEEFYRYVNDKRCLIVLNGLSTFEDWNRIKKCFPINKKGNRIVVSTTDVEVASLCVGQNSVVSELKQLSADQTIYAFHKETTATLCAQISTTPDSVQRAGDEDGNTRTKSSQDIAHSTESMSSSTMATSEIQDEQHNDANGNKTAGVVDESQLVGRARNFKEQVAKMVLLLKSSQDIAHSTESVATTSEIHDEHYNDANGKMAFGNKTAGVVDESQLAGREREKERIVNLILNHSDIHLEVIAVWGMGGIGKTTLLTDVYQRQELNKKFAKRAFVTVLRPFKLQELLRSIALQLSANSSGSKGVMDFARGNDDYASMSVSHLTKALDGLSQDQKCLIVVDDLLHNTEWDTIIEAFRKIEKAISWTIVIATRQQDVAKHCCKNSKCIQMLNILEAKEARDLFIKTVFKETIDMNKKYPELIEPAKLILNKCGGLPLAIVTIGSFLADEETKSVVEWRKLNAHITAEMEMNPKIELIRAVLMKSYDGLPYYLKPCFLYMSIFPEDWTISRRRLARRWAIEGYSVEARDKSCMEIADDYFEKLVERSMILPTYDESIFSRQKAGSCKIHDLIRDISISMSMKENFVFRLEEGCSSNTHGTVRHLAISNNWEGDEGEFQRIVELSCIRSLTVFGNWKPFYISDKMRFLRVLDLEDTKGLANHCLKNIGKLLHLRYISLRGCEDIFCLPDSVGNLIQLEVLDIKRTHIKVLPKTIVRLRKLHHVHTGTGYSPRASGQSCRGKCATLLKVQCAACLGHSVRGTNFRMWSRRDRCALACCAAVPPIVMGRPFSEAGGVTVPRGMRKLKSLHTLRFVHLAWGNAAVEEVKGLTSLRKLGVVGLSEKNSHNLCLAISKLSLLESLSLCSKLDLYDCLNGIKPPPENLQSLKLIGCRMARLPEWIKGLQNLVKLSLVNTGLSRDGADMLMQDIGKLRNLRILRLCEWSDITIGEVQFKCDLFKRLEVLDLFYGSNLKSESFKFDEEAMPKLEVLHLRLRQLVHFSGLEYLQSIKEVRVYYLFGFPEENKETFPRELREQLDKNKKGYVLRMVN